jgi:nucleotide-binding universal stress UspA family protein
MSAPPPSNDRVVVGVDGSAPSRQALLWARFLAEATGSTLHAITAWQQYAGYGWSGPGRTAVPTDLDPAADATRLLKEAVHEAYGEQAPPGLRASVGHGGAAKVLLEAVREPGCWLWAAGATAASWVCCWARSARRALSTPPARYSSRMAPLRRRRADQPAQLGWAVRVRPVETRAAS